MDPMGGSCTGCMLVYVYIPELLFRQAYTKSSPWSSSPDRLADSDCNSELLLTVVKVSQSLSTAAASGICLQVEVSNSSGCLQLWHFVQLCAKAAKAREQCNTWRHYGHCATWPLSHVVCHTMLTFEIQSYIYIISHVGPEEMHFWLVCLQKYFCLIWLTAKYNKISVIFFVAPVETQIPLCSKQIKIKNTFYTSSKKNPDNH